MSIAHIIEQHTKPEDSRPAWKPEWNIAGYLIAVVEDGTTIIREVPGDTDLTPYAKHYAAGLKKSTHRPFQRHRFALGVILNNGNFVPSFDVMVEGQREGNPFVDEGAWEALDRLLVAVKNWQQTDAAYQSDAYVDKTSGPPKAESRKTGKTERDRAKGKARPKTS